MYAIRSYYARLIGVAKAKELILTGDYISATEAEKLGLVNKVVSSEELIRITSYNVCYTKLLRLQSSCRGVSSTRDPSCKEFR